MAGRSLPLGWKKLSDSERSIESERQAIDAPLIDTCVYLERWSKDSWKLHSFFSCAQAARIRGLIAVADGEAHWERTAELCEQYATPGNPVLLFTAGLGPHDAGSCSETNLSALKQIAQNARCIALGPVGLDYSRMYAHKHVQLECCRMQVQIAKDLALPLLMHLRDRSNDPLGAVDDLIGILADAAFNPCHVLINCFTGSREELNKCVSQGFYIGISGFLGQNGRGADLRQALCQGMVPLEKLVLGSSSPFMRPDMNVNHNIFPQSGAKWAHGPLVMQPCALPAVCKTLAHCLGLEQVSVAVATSRNSATLFRLETLEEDEQRGWRWMPWPLPKLQRCLDESEARLKTQIAAEEGALADSLRIPCPESAEERLHLYHGLRVDTTAQTHTIGTITSDDTIPLGTDLDPHCWSNDWASQHLSEDNTRLRLLVRCDLGCRVLDAENIGFSFGQYKSRPRTYDEEGVKRAVRYFLEKGTRTIVVTRRDTTQEMLATAFPESTDVNVVLASRTDDVMLVKESYNWKCPIVSGDAFDDWKNDLRISVDVRSWMKDISDLQVRFSWSSTGDFMPDFDHPRPILKPSRWRDARLSGA